MTEQHELIRVGHIDLSFHDASARAVEAVLERHDLKVERSAAPHEAMFAALTAGEVDILVSAWLPASHGKYLAPIEDQVRKLTVLYHPYCIWGVPEHVPQCAVATIADLLKPDVLERMDRRIQGINPGAGISRFSQAIVQEYGLAAAAYHFEPGTEADCFDRFERATVDGDWIVVPLWHPQYLHNRYRIRPLEEPKGLLGGKDDATLIVRSDAIAKIGPAIDELSALYLGNDRVSAMDDELHSAQGVEQPNRGRLCRIDD